MNTTEAAALSQLREAYERVGVEGILADHALRQLWLSHPAAAKQIQDAEGLDVWVAQLPGVTPPAHLFGNVQRQLELQRPASLAAALQTFFLHPLASTGALAMLFVVLVLNHSLQQADVLELGSASSAAQLSLPASAEPWGHLGAAWPHTEWTAERLAQPVPEPAMVRSIAQLRAQSPHAWVNAFAVQPQSHHDLQAVVVAAPWDTATQVLRVQVAHGSAESPARLRVVVDYGRASGGCWSPTPPTAAVPSQRPLSPGESVTWLQEVCLPIQIGEAHEPLVTVSLLAQTEGETSWHRVAERRLHSVSALAAVGADERFSLAVAWFAKQLDWPSARRSDAQIAQLALGSLGAFPAQRRELLRWLRLS